MVMITPAAPAGGTVITLASDNSVATVPASVTVAEGQKMANFDITTSAVAAVTTVNISATANKVKSTALLSISPTGTVSGVTLTPTSVVGGTSASAKVILSFAAQAGGKVVNLSSDSAAATVPASITVPSGSTNATFTVTTTAVVSSQTATITASADSVSANAKLTIRAPGGPDLVDITGFQFVPQSITVAAGSSIQWTNSDGAPHTVTSDTGVALLASNLVFPTGMAKNDVFTWAVPAGAASGTTYYYHCNFHGGPGDGTKYGAGMVGRIVVK